MPAIINWLLRLLPTNPICMRLVQGGSKRLRHLYIRSGYLAVMIFVLVMSLISSGSAGSLRDLAKAGATTFEWISYLQVVLICLLTPVFMAGAIAQEANPQTWDIMLTTPLNSLQIVLGNLFGRLFFILALLFSTLPLFVMTQYFGGVPGQAIFDSYAIAGTSALLVASIAVTLSVTRTAGRRAVFIFYISVVMYLFITYAIDAQWRQRYPVAAGVSAYYTTAITPLNPFLALDVLLRSNTYVPRSVTQSEANWFHVLWFSRPIAAFCWLCVWLSLVQIAYSTLFMRAIGTRTGVIPWYRRLFRLGSGDRSQRPARHVSHNPIAWRESVARGGTFLALLGRWGFVGLGVTVALTYVGLFHIGAWSGPELRLAVGATVGAEIVIIVLVALNMSATAVSREREDGTLDIILTTPIQPGPYLAGKLRGLIQFLLPMILVPTLTMLILAVYLLFGGFGTTSALTVADPNPGGGGTIQTPVVLPIGALALPLTLVPFVAFCVMVGLQWSIRSKGTIGAVISAVGVVLVITGVLSLCSYGAARGLAVVGAVMAAFSPVVLVWAMVQPVGVLAETISQVGIGAGMSLSLVIGAVLAAAVYVAIVIGMHSNMKRTFMMTVRRLAGAN